MSAAPEYSQHKVESALHCSHHTINEVLQRAKQKGVTWPLNDAVTDEILQELLFPEKHQPIAIFAEPDYVAIHHSLVKPGVTLTLLHKEYTEQSVAGGQTPYMYTQFCEKYRRWAKITKATMRIKHKPGDAMQVDWAGNTLDITDPVTGEIDKAYLFVAVLPCSCYPYVELCRDMKLENWILCHVHTYRYFGGVTRLLIPDNLKTGVICNTRY